jgi:hypothetical protein
MVCRVRGSATPLLVRGRWRRQPLLTALSQAVERALMVPVSGRAGSGTTAALGTYRGG